ncbi:MULTISPECIES: WXG100 family type VII secretion target [Streptomyces]|uniref:WXG100 family type VII secretion target n=1 Tax=Streptomyces siderophoricus TaxID=2802281 RepID=A0ABS1MSG5_9ACTN|nr:WXG100 family type VII secretion target [Streptomyces sp. 9-7]MBL1090683.1 WXG100 family type VII secretion target [Streptomyces sp. 9-7]
MTYRINFPQVEHVTEEMRTISRNITNLLEALEDSARSSLAQWNSQARDAYTENKRQWDAAAAEMVQQSIEAGSTLEYIRRTYGQAEVTNTGMWG